MSNDTPNPDEIAQRVNRLETEYEQLRQQLDALSPEDISRREALSLALGAAGVGAVGGTAAESAVGTAAAAGNNDGDQLGTSSDPVDEIHAGDVGTSSDPVDEIHAGDVGTSSDPVEAVHADQADVTQLLLLRDADGRTTYDPADYNTDTDAIKQMFTDLGAKSSKVGDIRLGAQAYSISKAIKPSVSLQSIGFHGVMGSADAPTTNEPEGAVLNSSISDSTVDVLTLTRNTVGTDNEIRVGGFLIYGSGSENHGAVLETRNRGTVEWLSVWNTGNDGVHWSRFEEATAREIRAKNCGRHGIYLDASPGGNATLSTIESEGNTGDALHLAQGEWVEILPPVELENSDDGLYWSGSVKHSVVRRPKIENNNTGVNIDGSANYGRLIGPKLTSHSDRCINLSSTQDFTIADCLMNPDDGANDYIKIKGADRVRLRNLQFNNGNVSTKFNNGGANVDLWYGGYELNGESGVNPGSSSYTLSFDIPFSSLAVIEFIELAASNGSGTQYEVRPAGSYTTDANGNIDSMEVAFFDNTGSAVTPSSFTWSAGASNAGAT